MALPTKEQVNNFDDVFIETKTKQEPQFTIIYGKGDTGKTSTACYSPDPVIIPVGRELCHQRMLCPKMRRTVITLIPILHLFTCINYLLTKEHNRKTVIIDNLTSYREILEEDVVKTYKANDKTATSLGDFEFGKGQMHAYQYYKGFWLVIDALIKQRQLHVILIAHDGYYTINKPDGSYYQKLSLNAQGGDNTNARTLFESRAHNVLLMACEDVVIDRTSSMGVKRKMASGMPTKRIIYTKQTSAFFAKTKSTIEKSIIVEESENEHELLKELSNQTLMQLFIDLYS